MSKNESRILTILISFIYDNSIEMPLKRGEMFEHNFEGLREWKAGRKVCKKWLLGSPTKRNTDLEPNTLRVVTI